MVTRRVSAAEAKAHLSALVSEVAHARHHIIIERHGEPDSLFRFGLEYSSGEAGGQAGA